MKFVRPESESMTKAQALSLSKWVFENICFQTQGRWEVRIDLCISFREKVVYLGSFDCDSISYDRWETMESCENGFFIFLRQGSGPCPWWGRKSLRIGSLLI
jgi:hypothetical protein